jgi:uncharacterized membrane protein YfcA
MNELFLLAGVGLAAILSGAFGLAFPLIAGPLFLFEYRPAEALLLTASCTLLSNLLSALLLHRSLQYELRWRLIAPVLAGIPVGTEFVTHIQSAAVLKAGFGLLLVITSAFCMLPRTLIVLHERPLAEMTIGAVAGIIGGMFAAPAALPAIWLSLRDLGKLEIRAILQPLVILSQVVILVVLGLTGMIDLSGVKAVILYIPSIVAGVFLGVRVFNRLSSAAYGTAINVLVLISGVILIIK